MPYTLQVDEYVFRLLGDAELFSELIALNPRVPLSELNDDGLKLDPDRSAELSDLDQSVSAFVACLSHSLKDMMWVEGGLLVAPDGRQILIAGGSHTGKTTTSAALALSKSWKIVSEDLCFFDNNDQVLPLTVPLSLRPGTDALLRQCTAQNKLPMLTAEWLFASSLFQQKPVKLDACCALILEPVDQSNVRPLKMTSMSLPDFLGKLLQMSNAVWHKDGVNRIYRGLKNAKCLIIEGGSLKERLEAIDDLSRRRA